MRTAPRSGRKYGCGKACGERRGEIGDVVNERWGVEKDIMGEDVGLRIIGNR